MQSNDSHIVENIAGQYSTALTAYLHPNSAEEAVTISDIIKPVTDLFTDGHANEDHLGDAVESLWDVLIKKAETISWDDPAQDRLVSLLKELKCSSPPSDPAPQIWGFSLWSELTMFGASVLGTPWTNLNAFAARLAAAQVADFSLYAIWAMRSALETPIGDIRYDELNGTLQAASIWLQLYGQQMHDSTQTWEKSAQRGDPASGSPLYDGPSRFCRKRWSLWMARLAAVEREVPVEEKTQQLLRDASTKTAPL